MSKKAKKPRCAHCGKKMGEFSGSFHPECRSEHFEQQKALDPYFRVANEAWMCEPVVPGDWPLSWNPLKAGPETPMFERILSVCYDPKEVAQAAVQQGLTEAVWFEHPKAHRIPWHKDEQ